MCRGSVPVDPGVTGAPPSTQRDTFTLGARVVRASGQWNTSVILGRGVGEALLFHKPPVIDGVAVMSLPVGPPKAVCVASGRQPGGGDGDAVG